MRNDNDPKNSLLPQPGQEAQFKPSFHPLPGLWAKEQLEGKHIATHHNSSTDPHLTQSTEIARALRSEREQHEYWEKWQGVTPGKPSYEDPRAFQNTLLPTAKYGTDGRGYG